MQTSWPARERDGGGLPQGRDPGGLNALAAAGLGEDLALGVRGGGTGPAWAWQRRRGTDPEPPSRSWGLYGQGNSWGVGWAL